MKRFVRSLIATTLFAFFPPVLGAQLQSGSVEFVAHATPSGGLQEPVRGFPFFLLSKSYAEIGKEADAAVPKPDRDAFIDALEVSSELKAWMKKNHWIELSGDDFIHKLHSSDIMGVPEFFQAYMQRNSGDQSLAFPKPKYKPSEKLKDPAKYEKLHKEYIDAIRRYIDDNPQTIEGIDLGLADIDPSGKWNTQKAKRAPEIRRLALQLAESKYLVARAQTDLQGQGFLRNVPAGTYWLSTLDVSADVGDARPRWDIPVTVRVGETTYLSLTDANAVQSRNGSL